MYRLNDAEMFYDMADGQAVVINFSTGAYYGPNPLGSEILDRLLKGYAEEKIFSALKNAPGCPADIAEKFQRFINDLKNYNILVSGETAPGGDDAFNPSLLAEGFEMKIEEYKEVQDLILADPVHEVDAKTGWPVLQEKK